MFATFAKPSGVSYANQVLYVADADSSAIRAVRVDGRVQTLVGAGLFFFRFPLFMRNPKVFVTLF